MQLVPLRLHNQTVAVVGDIAGQIKRGREEERKRGGKGGQGDKQATDGTVRR